MNGGGYKSFVQILDAGVVDRDKDRCMFRCSLSYYSRLVITQYAKYFSIFYPYKVLSGQPVNALGREGIFTPGNMPQCGKASTNLEL